MSLISYSYRKNSKILNRNQRNSCFPIQNLTTLEKSLASLDEVVISVGSANDNTYFVTGKVSDRPCFSVRLDLEVI